MDTLDGIDWEDAFNNAPHIPGAERFPSLWAERAAAFRAKATARLDLAYGALPRERLDLFLPRGTPRGLAAFVHGGFWRAFDKSSWSDLAAGAVARGWAVVLPSYTLAPEARIAQIVQQVARAIAFAARDIPGPIRLAGHSVGGHAVTRMICEASPLPDHVSHRIDHVLSISGVHDLRPLRLHSMNDHLNLDAEDAIAESPVCQAPLPDIPCTVWVGAAERPEFLRQSAILAEAWRKRGAGVTLVIAPDQHHFDVIDPLRDPDSRLTRAFVGGDTRQG